MSMTKLMHMNLLVITMYGTNVLAIGLYI